MLQRSCSCAVWWARFRTGSGHARAPGSAARRRVFAGRPGGPFAGVRSDVKIPPPALLFDARADNCSHRRVGREKGEQVHSVCLISVDLPSRTNIYCGWRGEGRGERLRTRVSRTHQWTGNKREFDLGDAGPHITLKSSILPSVQSWFEFIPFISVHEPPPLVSFSSFFLPRRGSKHCSCCLTTREQQRLRPTTESDVHL